MNRRVLLTCIGLAACRATEPNGSGSPFLISNPVVNPAVLAVLGHSVGADLVYVSLPAGTIPNGLSVVIRNQRTSESASTSMVDGGLDPTAIHAAAGDTLDIDVSLSGSGEKQFVVTVPIRARPKVVRREPSRDKRDVPLNTSILVVFSEPIATGTLNSSTLQLRRGDVPVAGQIRFLDDTHAHVAFLPTEPLAPASKYRLQVGSAIRDQDGEPLEGEVEVDFTTVEALAAGELRVSVTTYGNAPDIDGYVIAIAGQSNWTIGSSDTLSLQLPLGTYVASLTRLAPYCQVVGLDMVSLTVERGTVTPFAFRVSCPSVPANGLLVTVTSEMVGAAWPSPSSNPTDAMQVDGGPDQMISPNGYTIISPIAPGSHTVAVQMPKPTNGTICSGWFLGDGWNRKTVTVPPDTFGRVDFKLKCFP